jgi:hypothetical protein
MAKQDATGRSTRVERYVKLHHWLLESPAWEQLTTPAVAIYVELSRRYNGSNNGRIALSVRDAAARCKIAQNTASRALRELQNLGFIVSTRVGGFARHTRLASEWSLTQHYCDLTKSPASKLFMSRGRTPSPQLPQNKCTGRLSQNKCTDARSRIN